MNFCEFQNVSRDFPWISAGECSVVAPRGRARQSVYVLMAPVALDIFSPALLSQGTLVFHNNFVPTALC